MLKPFEIRPHQDRNSSGEKVRGYWKKDLEDAFRRYTPPSDLGHLGQTNNDGGYSDFQPGTEDESCPRLESSETRTTTELSQVSQVERGDTAVSPSKGDL